MTHTRLTPAVREDLEEIWHYTAHPWSLTQANRHLDELEDVFNRLLAFPEMAAPRREFGPPVRLHLSDQHLIVCQVADDHLMVRGSSADGGIGDTF
ncbi:MAG: type II toxin-antitoxin system RelE/ParE family toxin [Pseudomonadota bacterium]|nr:type II toxin-antitoxin system RelE/ParE family toxin [Pseudomonadota bacterium]